MQYLRRGGVVALTSGKSFRPEAGEVAYHLGLLQAKIEAIAERAGVTAYDRLTVDGLLAALRWSERRRVSLFLKAAKAQSEDQALHRAIDILSSLASQVWTEQPDRASGVSGPQARVSGPPQKQERGR
jgi:hypothetical protein